MGWLLLKDIQILRRSPLLLTLLVVYPIVIAVLIGFALSRGPDKPRVAFVNLVPSTQTELDLAGESIDLAEYADTLFESIEPVRIDCEGRSAEECQEEALDKVRSGDVLAALVIPEDITQRLQALQSLQAVDAPVVRVFYNAEDPVKARYVQDTIKSRAQDANVALTQKLTQVALSYLDLIVEGGSVSLPLLGGDIDVLGLERSEASLRAAQAELPPGSEAHRQLDEVIRFGQLAQENLDLSDEVLGTIGTPIKIETEVLEGGTTPLSTFAAAVAIAISLMFVTVLLAAGTLALEREENAFRRLIRGLVSPTALLAEKALLATACSTAVGMLMLCGLAVFVDLVWGRFPLWVAGVAVGSLGFAALGLAVGALAREVRAASLLAFMLALPIAFLALVPSGAVSEPLYDVIRVVSALFPFKPTLDVMDAALNDAGGMATALAHLAALTIGFGALARVGLRRFA
ncbi:MAG TPA: ABC transporter permease [Thermoleophilaceae bacterium]|nr:ABC transporter permease [Thermoleophilaceae bacterium]